MFKSDNWFALAFCSLLFWGLWGFFQKLATSYISPRNVYVFAALGTLIIVFFTLLSMNFKMEMHGKGTAYAVLAGLTGAIGGLFFVHSVGRGKASIVITLTALYPVVTILLSFIILKEEITLRQGIGVLLALISMALLSM
ncbi:MAG: EamA family transporter [Nitrospirae bacterium]|nr:EamA family transporter [Nitrospirota bacterium]